VCVKGFIVDLDVNTANGFKKPKNGKAIEDGQASGFVSAGKIVRRAHLRPCQNWKHPEEKSNRPGWRNAGLCVFFLDSSS
jgi:hypothetical protein